MLRISQIKLDINHTEEDLKKSVLKKLRISPEQLQDYKIVKKSIDARKKNEIKYTYSIDVLLKEEKKLSGRLSADISFVREFLYEFKADGTEKQKERPVVIGSGPAGLFCALMLAEHGYCPLVLERGEEAEKRVRTVEHFWKTNKLNTNSNVQFGEGGAGTFSDGKLNTLVKDPVGRNKKVLEIFAEHGAPSDILYLNKPHIGTDKLRDVVKSMRNRIIELGGEVRFQTQAEDFIIENDSSSGRRITGIVTVSTDGKNIREHISCQVVVLAVGHSARDTFSMIHEKGFQLIQKSFAIGVRIEHPQKLISENQYGSMYQLLPPADYKLTHQAQNGRNIYSFCMCPGGFVVNAASEERGLTVNGMSNYNRGERNANSALIVSVTPDDFVSDSPLAGVQFQRKWESLAYEAGNGKIPVQLFGDLKNNRTSTALGSITPNCKGGYRFSNLKECLPSYVTDTLVEGIHAFDRKIHGFANEEAVLLGVETRTSSPLRINRNELFESNIHGVYPCGEGAGYAGGITSAAMDGIKAAEAVAHKYKA